MLNAKAALVILALIVGAAACGNEAPRATGAHASAQSDEQTPIKKLDKIGVQLYTLRNEMEADFEGTLRRVAEIGYDEVEFAGLFGRSPQEVKRLLAELELTPVASHVNWAKFRDDPEAMIDETVALGAEYMILAWLPEEERKSAGQWREWIARMNAAGALAHEKGVKFAFHNHDFEFIEVDGVKPYDLIMEGIDRRYVQLELDLYWIELAGEDPAKYFAQYKGGFPLSHVKDMRAVDQSIADVGAGAIDFGSVFRAAEEGGMKHFIVEHDNADDPFQSITASLAYLRALEY